jgi:hypothetical protein
MGKPKEERPRIPIKIGARGQFVKINGRILQVDEIRSVSPLSRGIHRSDCVLTHILHLKPGCMGDDPNKAIKKLWITDEEYEALEKLLLT